MPKPSRTRAFPIWVVPVVMIVIAALAIWGILSRSGGDESATAAVPTDTASAPTPPTRVQGPEDPNLTELARRDPNDPLTAGPVDAPVTLLVYSDYQCAYCAKWSAETLPALMEFTRTGDLRIEYRDVNIFGPDSERAARASYAAAMQGRFWEYHDALFPGGQVYPDLSDDGLLALADELGLDTTQFTTDMNSPETAAAIAANQQEGLDLGAYSTPSFVLGDQPIVGAQPTQVFLDAYEVARAAAQ